MHLSDLLAAMQSYGLQPPLNMIPGKWTRFPGIGKKGKNTAGYCLLFPDGLGAVFGDYASGLKEIWQAEKVKEYTPAERINYQKMIEEAQKRAAEEQEKEYANAAAHAQKEWDRLPLSTDEHGYLIKKKVKNHGLRQKDIFLVMPFYNSAGIMTTYQTISPEGEKKLMYGGRKKGSAYPIPGDPRTVYITEGYATGATVHEATGCMVIVAVDAGNILPVATEAVKKYNHVVVCADNDDAGLKAARETESGLDIPYIYPEGIEGTDFNDMAVEQGLEAVREAVLHGRMIRTYERTEQSTSYPDEILNPPGLLKTIADYYNATAIRPQPLFGIATGLALGSVVLGRRYRSEYKNYTSLYMIVAAKSGTGKDHVKQVCREILKAAGMAWMERSEGFTAANTVVHSLEGQPLQISFFEEIGLRLQEASAANTRSLARGTFRKLLDIFSSCHSFSVSEEYADKSVHRVDRPALTMVGLTTPRALTEAISESLIEQGFVNRILPFISREDRRPMPLRIQSSEEKVPEMVVKWIQGIFLQGNLVEAGVPVCPDEKDEIILTFTTEALEKLNQIDIEIVEKSNTLEKVRLDDMLSRNREIAMRISVVAAAMDSATEINVKYVEWAWSLVSYLYDQYISEIRRHVSGSEYEKAKLEALEALRSATKDGGIRPADMGKGRPWSKWQKKMRSEILTELQESGLAEKITVRTGKKGKPKQVWVALK